MIRRSTTPSRLLGMSCGAPSKILALTVSISIGNAMAQSLPQVEMPNLSSLPNNGIGVIGGNKPAGGQQQTSAGGGSTQTDAVVVPPGRDPSSYAFDSAAEQLLPLTPEEIAAYRAARQRVDRASSVNAGPQNLAGTVRTIDMMDGAPRTLSLVSNFSTVVMPIGENGAPWPITQVLSANPEIVAVTQPQGRTTAVVLSVKQAWMRTNVTVFLEGRAEPIILFIDTTADAIEGLDARVGLLVSGTAPGTTLPPVKNIAGVDSSLLNAVHMSPGNGWTVFDVKGDQQQLPFKMNAWLGKDGQEAIIRIQGASLLSPAWDAQVSNADGDVKAYRYTSQPFMFLVSDADGVTYRVRGAAPTAQLANGQRAKLEVEQLGARQIDEVARAPVKARSASVTQGPRSAPVSLTGSSSVSRVSASSSAVATGTGASSDSVPPAIATLSSTTPEVHGAASLPKTRSNLKPIFLTGSDAVVRYEASRYHDEEPAAPGHPVSPATQDPNSGAVFAKASGSALIEPPSVTTASDPIVRSETVNVGMWQFKVSGPSLRNNLERLSREAGWSRLVWKSGDDYRVSDGLVFRGADALAVVRQILDRYPLRLEFYELNQVGVIVPRVSRSGFIGEKQ